MRTPGSAGPSFAARLRAGERLLGPLLRMPNEVLVELTGLVGMDFVVVDTEHGPGDQIPLTAHLVAARAAGLAALVRVGAVGELLRVLDLGADGVIYPHVGSVAQARAVVAATRYPPAGERGFATYSRSGRYGLASADAHLEHSAANTAVILMIEDAEGVAAAAEIAALDGVDGLFVGPADLSVSLGHPGQPGHPEVVAAIATVHAAARRAGKAVVTICADAATARAHFDAGSTAVMYNLLSAQGALFQALAGAKPPASEQTQGSPLPIVLLPGMLGTPALWDKLAAELGGAHPLCALRIDRDDNIADMAESVLAQAPPTFALVGHSLGGVVALEVARRAPDRVRKLALVAASGRDGTDAQRRSWQQLDDAVAAGRFEEVLSDQAVANLGSADVVAAHRDEFVAMGRQVGPDGLRRELAAQAARPDSRPGLSGLTVPTLVVSGGQDRVCPPERQAEMVAGLADARHVTLPGVGHMVPMEAAAALAAALRDFFG